MPRTNIPSIYYLLCIFLLTAACKRSTGTGQVARGSQQDATDSSRASKDLEALRKEQDPTKKAKLLKELLAKVELHNTGATSASALWETVRKAWTSNKLGFFGPLRKTKKKKKLHTVQKAFEYASTDKIQNLNTLLEASGDQSLAVAVTLLKDTNQGPNVFTGNNGKGKRKKTKKKIQITQAQSTALAQYLEILAAYALLQ